MTKEEKSTTVLDLTDKMKSYSNFYITDSSGIDVAQTNVIRKKCFEKGIKFIVAKNTLIKRAMQSTGVDYEPLFSALKGFSGLMFSDTGNVPAKLISELRKNNGSDKPVLKGAYIDQAFFLGDNQLETLANLKSKQELIGDIVYLLHSPVKNVISGLKSGGSKLAGIIKTLSERSDDQKS